MTQLGRSPNGAAYLIALGDKANTPVPLRATLTPEVEKAACTIHRAVWGEPYTPGGGPMHFAGGPYWRRELLRQAGEWERMAAAARICAEALPEKDD